MKMLSNRTGGTIPALILAVLLVTGLSASKVNAQDYNNYNNNDGYYNDNNNYGDYQEFYDDLSPHGQWLNDPQYGYVWTPNVGRDFRPYYTNGHWVMTEYGNMWVSDYSWGWAPFHYGRWAQSSYYGWIWIPGREWGPAWVNWRQGGGYYGWAPMGPGISINISFGSGYNVPNPWWTFIPCGNIYSRSYSRYYSPRQTVNIINNTTIINNTYVDNRSRNTYITGPRRSDVETATRQKVTVYNVNNQTRAGAVQVSGRNVNVYRPAVSTLASNTQQRPAPRQVKVVERSVITNTGGGRAPARQPLNSGGDRQMVQPNNPRNNQTQQRIQRDQQPAAQQVQRDQQVQQQRVQQQQSMQRDQQVQQQRVQRDQQAQQQRVQQQQAQQQSAQMQRDQQVQQQRVQQQQQQAQQQRAQIQRDQQVQQQRVQQQAQQQRVQQQAQQQRSQQVQQQRVQQQRSAPVQRVERSAPAPQERAAEAAPRGR